MRLTHFECTPFINIVFQTSGAITRILHNLTEKPAIQQRLRREIIDSGIGGTVPTSDELNSLPYLDAIIKETLRL